MSFNNFLPPDESGTNDFFLTASEIIDNSLDVLQVGSDGEGADPETYGRALNELNLVLRELQAQGLHITTFETGFLFLTANQTEYTIENEKSTNEYFQTTLSADAIDTATSITVTDSTKMLVDDSIGIFKNDNNLFWSTIVSITPTVAPAATVVIADALDGAADSGCDILNYRDALIPVDRVTKTLRRDFLTTDIPISQLSRDEYWDLPFKNTTAGQISQAYYWRQRVKGKVFLWPPAPDSQQIFVFCYESRLDDMKGPTDALPMDRMYLPVVVRCLALRMCNRLGISTEIMQRVQMERDEMMQTALSYDDEVTDFSISLQRTS